MASVPIGATLQTERLRQKLSLQEIALRTRISIRFLEAIEADAFARLPGIVFARNFVRQYAATLGVDAEPLLAGLPRVDLDSVPMPNPPARERQSRWDPRWNSAVGSVAWLVLAVAAATGAYYYFNFNRPDRSAEKPVARVTRAPAVPAPAPAPAPAPTMPQQVPADPVPVVAAAIPTEKAMPVQVLLTAKEASWVQVTADGKPAFTGTMQPNDTKSIGAEGLVKIVAGNAGGIALTLNGRPLDPIGPSGQVRSVRLTAEGLQLVSKTPPPAGSNPL